MFGEIKNQHGELLDYSFHPGDIGRKEVVVIGHDLTANKDQDCLRAIAEGLSIVGLPALRLSFSGNGASEGEFVAATVSKATADLGAVFDALDGFRIAYVGHGLGAAAGVLRVCSDTRVLLLVSLAGMVHTRGFADRHFGHLVAGGGFMWDRADAPLSSAFVEDMNSIGTLVDRAVDVAMPWLMVHGDADEVVPLEEGEQMFAAANEPKEFRVIPNADHGFRGEAMVATVKLVCSWLGDRLA